MARARKREIMPMIPLRGLVIYPTMVLHFDVVRDVSIKALEATMAGNQLVFVAAQRDLSIENPTADDVYTVGTVIKVKQLLKLPHNSVRVLVEGLYRAEIIDVFREQPYFECETLERFSTHKNIDELEEQAIKRMISEMWSECSSMSPHLNSDLITTIEAVEDLGQYADSVASGFLRKIEDKQSILEEFNVSKRLTLLITMMRRELEIIKTESEIFNKVREQIDKNQRDYFLREQIKVISKELGDDADEIAEYEEKIHAKKFPDEVREKAEKELNRLEKTGSQTPEAGVIRNYLDTLLDLPYGVYTKESNSIKKAERILNHDHYGLEKVKKRILEYLSVKILAGSLSGQIICLVGPPGVGKTSIAKSIAEALGRNYVRISLGGVRDEADIRGHRKTYIGSMPGRIIASIIKAGSANPLMLLDEVDKLGSDYKGDPSSALLEALDSAQNNSFRDHYVEVPFDLSDVLFITTANNADTIPAPLLDRMEIIEISGYTSEEKEKIAMRHLIPKCLETNGITPDRLKIGKSAISDIITYYTREAGVRNLEREISTLCRRAAMRLVNGEDGITVSSRNLTEFLGRHRFKFDKIQRVAEAGVVRGLAWTRVGGDTLNIEVCALDGTGKIELTGNLGQVMKESAFAAVAFIRSRATALGIDNDFYKNKDIHLHVPEGAVPKDGPSAGITICTAIVSALTGRCADPELAMTGEVTITGRVLAIGGVLEKVLAAYRCGVTKIILPKENEPDLEDIPKEIRSKLTFLLADNMDYVLSHALLPAENKPVDVAIPVDKHRGTALYQ